MHLCVWCYELIPLGSSYVSAAGCYCGDFYHHSMHVECEKACSRWAKRELWPEELPDEPMNRGGIEPRGEPENEPLDDAL